MSKRLQQKEETRAALLSSARELFVERGYDDTTMRHLAKKAGVAAGTVFAHFPDKASLLAAIFYDFIEETMEGAYATLDTKATSEEQMAHMVRCLFRRYAENPNLSRTLVKESFFLSGEWGDRMTEQGLAFLRWMEGLLERERERGELREGVELSIAALGIWSHYTTALIFGLREGMEDFERYVGIFSMLLGQSMRGYRKSTEG
ncbi:MAG: TetR/AcrR family transcriptional regulator [Myxococcales bacterium]|nr:TetR/AcrR family transcriptional regulator [Myxococcales bacterium]